MAWDTEGTKRKILAAAVTEFAAHARRRASVITAARRLAAPERTEPS